MKTTDTLTQNSSLDRPLLLANTHLATAIYSPDSITVDSCFLYYAESGGFCGDPSAPLASAEILTYDPPTDQHVGVVHVLDMDVPNIRLKHR